MKKFEKIYKDKFLENLGVEDNLEKIKGELHFEDNSPIKLKTTSRKSLIFSLSGVCAALVAIIFTVFVFMSPKIAGDYTPTFLRMEVVDNKVRASNNIIDSSLPDGLKNPDVSYYAKPGDKVTIAVYLDNLKQYEILSFSLNQQLYPSYMFKQGSTAEVIYVDVLAGETPGIKPITIDKIKYVDGTEIKEAKYQGERTIHLGVEYVVLPTLTTINEVVGNTNYKLDFKLENYDLITNDIVYNAYLVNNKEVIETKKLSVTDNVLEFNNLYMNSIYEVYIVCNLDILNGNGFEPIYLYEKTFNTKSGLNNINIISDYNSINVNYIADQSVQSVSTKLLKDGKLVKEIKDNVITFNNLLTNTTYLLEIEYTYLLNGNLIKDIIKETVKTKAYGNQPTASGTKFALGDSLFYEINLEDKDNVMKSYVIEIVGDGEILYSGTKLSDTITLNKNYSVLSVKVKIAYDFNDGEGLRTVIIEIK